MSLYRRYRPQTFADVAGQDHIVETLVSAVKQDQIAHAYLFAGPRGTGKTSIARILAKHILTRGIDVEERRAAILQEVDDGSLVDLMEIDAASNTGVDDIRSLIEKIQFSPSSAAAKVFIIDEAHMLSKSAFNALLKTLEEPPPYAYFILATTEVQKIPLTILSRCQRFPFRKISEEDIIRRLQFIADAERITVDRNALRIIAKHAGGALRDALSLLDQLRSLPTITPEDIERKVGATGTMFTERILAALSAKSMHDLPAIIEEIEQDNAPFEHVAKLLLTTYREELHRKLIAKEDVAELANALSTILEGLKNMRAVPVPAVVFEGMLLSLAGVRTIAPPLTIPSPVEVPLRASTAPAASRLTGKERKKEEDPPIQKPAADIQAPPVSFQAIMDVWPKILAQAKPASVQMSMRNGRLHAVNGDTIVVCFHSEFDRSKASSPRGNRSIEDGLQEHFKVPLHVKCILETEVAPPSPPSKEDVDVAEAAQEIF